MAIRTNDFIVNYDFTGEDKEITVNNKNTAVRIEGMTKAQVESALYKIENNKLVITYNGTSLKISNYNKIKYIKTDYYKSEKKNISIFTILFQIQ